MKLNLRVVPKFPAEVSGSGFVTISKVGATYTFGTDYSLIGPVVVLDPTAKSFVVQDSNDGSQGTITIASILASGYNFTTVTAAGDFNIGAADTYIRLNKTVPATTNINLPAASVRNGLPLTIKDVAGNADTYNFSIVPNGSEKIDGLSSYAGTMKFQVITLVPVVGGWDVIHSG